MVNVEVSSSGLTRIEKLLAGISGGFDEAVNAAMTRAVSHLRTNTGSAIREKYDISQANLRTEQNVRVRYSYQEGVHAEITYAGYKIPLHRFGGASPKEPTINKEYLDNVFVHGFWKRVYPGIEASGHQLKETAPQPFENAFVARMKSGHVGIFERTGAVSSTGSDAIRELMGSSIPQMLGSEEVERHLSEEAVKKFDERLDYEVTRILNGWRR